jgi:phytoene/squalene synthetase
VLGGIYSRVLNRIEANGYDVFQQRISLSSNEKIFLTLRIWLQSLIPVERLAAAW